MEFRLFLMLSFYFLLGGLITFHVNKTELSEEKRKNWLKYFVYLFLVNALFCTIVFLPSYFKVLGLLVICGGLIELISNAISTHKFKIGLVSLLVFMPFALGFYTFCGMDAPYLLFTLFQTTVFDAFSQLSGQLMGKNKLVPSISPNKTWEGLLGGIVFSVITAAAIHSVLKLELNVAILFGAVLSIAAFIGDLLASLCKRKFGIKDFSNFIPGHGGFLDRFDSLLASGTCMYLIFKLYLI
ncbi:MAG: phosphatidate cytidylyltransferase [Saprospiraceae bacterium]